MVKCFLGLGSNLGERLYYITTAINRIKTVNATRVVKVSSVIESEPQGVDIAQGNFLNCVIEIETELSPYELLSELQKIEYLLGRVRDVAGSARTIDLDILTYADACINEEALCIPHPRMLERDFVLLPLKEIGPDSLPMIRKLSLKNSGGRGKAERRAVKRPARKTIMEKSEKRSVRSK